MSTELTISERRRLLKAAHSLNLHRRLPASPAIRTETRGEFAALSYAQQRLWFLAQMEGMSRAYHIPVRLRVKGRLNVGVLRRALDRIVARHEVLRTTFLMARSISTSIFEIVAPRYMVGDTA